MPFLKRNAGFFTISMAVVDSLCVLGSYVLAVQLTLEGAVTFHESFSSHIAHFIVFVVVWCGAATDRRLFASHRGEALAKQLYSTAKAVLTTLALTILTVLFFNQGQFEQLFLIVFGTGAALSVLLVRLVTRLTLWSLRRHGLNFRQIVLVGANPRAERLIEIMRSHGRWGYHILGVLEDDPVRAKSLERFDIPYMGDFKTLEKLLVDEVIDEVYISLPIRSHYQTIQEVANLCEGVGVPVRFIADLFPLRIATSRLHHLDEVPLLSLSAIPEAHGQLLIKRMIDVVLSGLALLLVCSWLFPLVALLIKLESRGPVFFLQERVGQNQRLFKMIKFRSMVQDAEARMDEVAELNEADGPVFKIRKDPRVTYVGRVIRKISIDELPQLINVFVGQMSLVGPRPPIRSEVEQYTWDQRRRLSVKPGVTGIWQISGRSDVSFDDWVEMDLAYIDQWSLFQDFRILVRTFRVVILGRGAA